jgi:YD repeat-containing protein
MPRARRPTLIWLLAAILGLACATGCLGRKSRENVQYYRGVVRSADGLRRGEGLITRKQADTQEHWRVTTLEGRTVKLARHDVSGALVEEIRIIYGAGGRVAEENTHSPDGRLEESLAFAYDDKGRLIGYSRRTAVAGLREQRRWSYDEQGRLKELRAFGPSGVAVWRDEFAYDPKDPAKWLGVKRFASDNAPPELIPADRYSLWD